MVNIANKQGSEEVQRDWLMDGKFELDLENAQAAAQWARPAVDKQLVPVKVTDAGGEKGFFFFSGSGRFEKHEMKAFAWLVVDGYIYLIPGQTFLFCLYLIIWKIDFASTGLILNWNEMSEGTVRSRTEGPGPISSFHKL